MSEAPPERPEMSEAPPELLPSSEAPPELLPSSEARVTQAAPWRETFEVLADGVHALAGADEVWFLNWRAEASDFARFNHGRLRQGGTVARHQAQLRLHRGRRSVGATLTLAGAARDDLERLSALAVELRTAVDHAEPDPWAIHDTDPSRSVFEQAARMPSPEQVVDTVRDRLSGEDLVGFLMGGPNARALASSLGHRHYHQGAGWSFDYSLFAPGAALRDKAVKSSVAGRDWDADAVGASIREAAATLPLLMRPMRRLERGRYRAWLAPRAVAELLGMLNWGGLSARAHLTGQSPMDRLRRGEARFDPRVRLGEDLAGAGAPRFQDKGFVRPAELPLVTEGRFDQWLASPRSAREFAIASNAASPDESAEALSLQPGTLADGDAHAALDNGLAISNLWYLNYSDRQAARVTGMTRFATLWVEDGQPVAPVEVMRFDDSLFDLLGANLQALGATAHWLPDISSCDWRGFGGVRAPALLLRAMHLTL